MRASNQKILAWLVPCGTGAAALAVLVLILYALPKAVELAPEEQCRRDAFYQAAYERCKADPTCRHKPYHHELAIKREKRLEACNLR